VKGKEEDERHEEGMEGMKRAWRAYGAMEGWKKGEGGREKVSQWKR